MASLIGCTHSHYLEKQDIKAEKLRSHQKLKDWNVTVVNQI